MTDLKNRIALVTGASRGIGAGIAIALAKAGANVAALPEVSMIIAAAETLGRSRRGFVSSLDLWETDPTI